MLTQFWLKKKHAVGRSLHYEYYSRVRSVLSITIIPVYNNFNLPHALFFIGSMFDGRQFHNHFLTRYLKYDCGHVLVQMTVYGFKPENMFVKVYGWYRVTHWHIVMVEYCYTGPLNKVSQYINKWIKMTRLYITITSVHLCDIQIFVFFLKIRGISFQSLVFIGQFLLLF